MNRREYIANTFLLPSHRCVHLHYGISDCCLHYGKQIILVWETEDGDHSEVWFKLSLEFEIFGHGFSDFCKFGAFRFLGFFLQGFLLNAWKLDHIHTR